MFVAYTVFGAAWAYLCYKNLSDLLPIQYYLSGLVGLLVVEMVANWGKNCLKQPVNSKLVHLLAYYRYLNAHGKSTASTVFLIVGKIRPYSTKPCSNTYTLIVAILDAGRNSMSFFMLLVVSLGLSVVRESLGRTMIKCQALAAGHFVFGSTYRIFLALNTHLICL